MNKAFATGMTKYVVSIKKLLKHKLTETIKNYIMT